MIEYTFHFFESLDSTNSQIKRLYYQGAPEGSLVLAEAQTAGRGRLGRRWISPPGNIYFSILLKPKVALEVLSQLALVAGAALAKTLKHYIKDNAEITLKWPNDVLLNQQKVAGILVETDIDSCLVDGIACYLGIGINMVTAPELTAYPAISFKEYSEFFPAKEIILNLFLQNFNELYDKWHDQGFSRVKQDWLQFAHGLGEIAVATAAREGQISGQFQTISDQGAMVLIDENGKTHIVSSSEVTFPYFEGFIR